MDTVNLPVLRHIADLWTIAEHPSSRRDLPLERKLVDIKKAGFDGFTALLTRQHAKLAKNLDLMTVGYFSSTSEKDLEKLIGKNLDAGAVHINVQLGNHDTLTPEALRLAIRLMSVSKKRGALTSIEVHRNTCTETPEKTYALASKYLKATGEILPLTWDFSHLSVVSTSLRLTGSNYSSPPSSFNARSNFTFGLSTVIIAKCR